MEDREKEIETPRCNGACQMAFHVYRNASFTVAQCRQTRLSPVSTVRLPSAPRAITPISDHVLVPIDGPILRLVRVADIEFHRRSRGRQALALSPATLDLGFCVASARIVLET